MYSTQEAMTAADYLWTLAFSLIMVSGILGNSIVLWVVLGKKNFSSTVCCCGVVQKNTYRNKY
jgi:hypothetical protein